MSSSIFRDIPIDSPVRRLRAESKLVSMVAMSMALVFEPTWPMIGTAALLGAVVFRLAKLPIGILPRPPRILLYGVLGGMIGASLSGGDPAVLGLGLGGLLDYLRLILLGLVLIFWAGLLAWSTGLAELGAGLRRLINPLRRVGLPTDELGTVLALAVRALPLVADEVMVVADATMTRPTPPSKRKGPGCAFAWVYARRRWSGGGCNRHQPTVPRFGSFDGQSRFDDRPSPYALEGAHLRCLDGSNRRRVSRCISLDLRPSR